MTQNDAIISILVTQKIEYVWTCIVWCELIRFYKHVKACLKILKSPMQIDTILQTYQDLFWSSKTSDSNWYNSTNMSRLVIMLWYNLIWFYVSQTCLKDDEILLNLSKQHKMQGRKGKCKDKKENARTT